MGGTQGRGSAQHTNTTSGAADLAVQLPLCTGIIPHKHNSRAAIQVGQRQSVPRAYVALGLRMPHEHNAAWQQRVIPWAPADESGMG